jgi:hypothetical protein
LGFIYLSFGCFAPSVWLHKPGQARHKRREKKAKEDIREIDRQEKGCTKTDRKYNQVTNLHGYMVSSLCL